MRVSPRIRPRVFICKNIFLGGGFFEGGSLFQNLKKASGGFLKYDPILQLCFPRVRPYGGYSRGGMSAKMTFRWKFIHGGGGGLILVYFMCTNLAT